MTTIKELLINLSITDNNITEILKDTNIDYLYKNIEYKPHQISNIKNQTPKIKYKNRNKYKNQIAI